MLSRREVFRLKRKKPHPSLGEAKFGWGGFTAHHKIISDILRHINNSIFKGNTEDTLLWMETELNNHTWEAFNSMTF